MNLLLLLTPAHSADFFEGFGFYLGDPHVHTGYSGDGGSSDLHVSSCEDCGAFEDVTDIARRNGLDFVSISDHVNGEADTSHEGFEEIVEATIEGHDPDSGFLTLLGAEVWFRIDGSMVGHKNLYIFAENEALEELELDDVRFNGSSETIESCDAIWEWAEEVEERWGSAVIVPHHPAATGEMTTDWRCHQSEAAARFSPVAEIYSRHGSSDWTDSSFDPLWMGYSQRGSLGFAMDPQGMALRMGFFGGTDSHDTNPGGVCDQERKMSQHPYGGGLTIAVIPESDPFDREHLYQAVLSRQTYATSGPLLPAVVRYESGGAYLGGMGEYVGLPDAQPLSVVVNVPPDLDSLVIEVNLVGPGLKSTLQREDDGRYSLQLLAEDVPAWAYPEITVDGQNWDGAGGCEDGGSSREERIWLSPTWFDTTQADLDGDGVSWAEGDCDDGDPETHPGAVEVCDNGMDEDCDGAIDDEDDDCAVPDTGTPADDIEAEEAAEPERDVTVIGSISPTDGCATVRASPGLASWVLLVLLARRRSRNADAAGGPGGL